MIFIFYERALKEVELLEKQMQQIQQEIDMLPEGKFYCSKNGKYYKWYLSQEGKSTYIQKKDKAYAEQLARRKFLMLRKEEIQNESKELKRYIKHHNSYTGLAEKLLQDPAYQSLMSKYYQSKSDRMKEWVERPYRKNQNFPEQLINPTYSGVFVRTKTDAMIEMQLYMNEIPFHYEECLWLEGRAIYPNFTIMHPETGELFYWEHFKVEETLQYLHYMSSRIETYVENDILPTHKLILTFETEEIPLTSEVVKDIINFYFL